MLYEGSCNPEDRFSPGSRSSLRSLLAALGRPLARARPLEERSRDCVVVDHLQPLAIWFLPLLAAALGRR